MKYLFFFIVFFLLFSCNNKKSVYWCGDHPCINKSEKEAYFKKTMTVEIKDIKNSSYEDKSEINKIIGQAQLNEKNRQDNEISKLNNEKINEKIEIQSEKALAKQLKIDEKKRIKNEKKSIKQAKIKKKQNIKNEKKLSKDLTSKNSKRTLAKNNNKNKLLIDKNYSYSNKFDEIVKKIKESNSKRNYPDINDVPN